MRQRFYSIGTLTAEREMHSDTGLHLWELTVENHHGDSCTFTTPFQPPPVGTSFKMQVTECGSFYGGG